MSEVNLFKAEKFEPIIELEVNDITYKAKGSFMFDIHAEKYAQQDSEGNKTSGYHHIMQGILNRKTTAIVEFWDCALAHIKQRPSKEEIQDAILKVIEEKDGTIGLLQGAIQVLGDSGFFREQFKMFWFQMNQAPTLVKEEDREEAKNALPFMKEIYTTLTGKKPY